jgi:hypothetical protein
MPGKFSGMPYAPQRVRGLDDDDDDDDDDYDDDDDDDDDDERHRSFKHFLGFEVSDTVHPFSKNERKTNLIYFLYIRGRFK